MRISKRAKIVTSFILMAVISSSSFISIYYLNIVPNHNKIYAEVDERQPIDETDEIVIPEGTEADGEISTIGTNVLILANQSYNQLIDDIFSGTHITPIVCFNKQKFMNKLYTLSIDIIIILSGEENFTSDEIAYIENLILNGRNFIATSSVLHLNSEFKSILGINESIEISDHLVNTTITSDYYLTKNYLNKVFRTKNGGTLFIPESTSMILAQFDKWRPPFLQVISKSSNVTKTSSGHDIAIHIRLQNTGWSSAIDVIIQEVLNGFKIKRANLNYSTDENLAKFEVHELNPNEELIIEFTLEAPSVSSIKEFSLITEMFYLDQYGNNYKYPDVNLYNYFDVEIISPLIEIEVSAIKILAWSDDPSDKYFLSEVLNGSWSYVEVNSVKDLMSNLTQLDYDILWLMDFGWSDFSCNYTLEDFLEWICKLKELYKDFGECEAHIIKEWVGKGGKIISSDWALQLFQKSLYELYGIRNLGYIPPIFLDTDEEYLWNGIPNDHTCNYDQAKQTSCCEELIEWDWYHLISLSGDHPINQGYNGTFIKSKAWAFDIDLYTECEQRCNPNLGLSNTIAYFCRPTGCSGEIILEDSPAIIASTYKEGRGVYFSPDIGRSAFKNYNTTAWIDIAKNAMTWLAFGDNDFVEPEPVEFIIPEVDIPKQWVDRYLNSNLPSISISSVGEGRCLFFSFDPATLLDSMLSEIIYNACFRMILLEENEGFVVNRNNLISKEFQFMGKGHYMLYLETSDPNAPTLIIYLDGEEIEHFIFPLNWTAIPLVLDQEGMHTLRFELNSSLTEITYVNITHVSIQSPLLFHNNEKYENVVTTEFNFKGGGYLTFMTNSSGQDLSLILDGEYIGVSNFSEYAAIRDNKYVNYGFHSLKINNSVGFNLSSTAVFFDMDLDEDGIDFYRELVYKTHPTKPDPWALWTSLNANFWLNNTIRTHNFIYNGETIIYIPSDFSEELLVIKILSITGKLFNFSFDGVTIELSTLADEYGYRSIDHPTTLVITSNITEGYHRLNFRYREVNSGCEFKLKVQIKDRFAANVYDGDITDSDGDGLCDSDEIDNGLHPFSPDVDGDMARDGFDFSPTLYEEVSTDAPLNYSIPIHNENFTTKISIQIKVPTPNYQQANLTWNKGHVDIVPMLRVFGPHEYNNNDLSYFGDDLPSRGANNGYISIIPLSYLTDESLFGAVFYEPNHPAFEDHILNFTYDFVWAAMQKLDNGSIYPLHLWTHPNNITIQAMTKVEMGPIDLAFVSINDSYIAKNYYDFIRYQIAPYNNYSLQLPDSFMNKVGVEVIKDIPYLNSSDILRDKIEEYKTSLPNAINNEENYESFILTSIIEEIVSIPFEMILNKSKVQRKQIIKSDTLYRIFEDVNGSVASEIVQKPGFHRFYYNTETIRNVAEADGVLTLNSIEAIEIIICSEIYIHFKLQYSLKLSVENEVYFDKTEEFFGSIYSRGEIIIYRFFAISDDIDGRIVIAEAIRLIEISELIVMNNQIENLILNKFSKDVNQFLTLTKVLNKGISTGFKILSALYKVYNWVKDLKHIFRLLEPKPKKMGWWANWKLRRGAGAGGRFYRWINSKLTGKIAGGFYKVISIITGIIGFVFSIQDTITFIQLAVAAPDGTPLIARVLLWTAAGLSALSAVLSLYSAFVAYEALILGLEASATASALSWIGLIVAIALFVIIIILLFIRPLEVDYEIIGNETGPLKPRVFFDKSGNRTINYKFSPETGAKLNIGFFILNQGEAALRYFNGRMTIGQNSWGNWFSKQNIYPITDPEGRHPNGWGLFYLNISATCQSWGAQLDVLIHIDYDFYDDWIDPEPPRGNGPAPLWIFMPLDTNINVFPQSIDQFLNELSPEKVLVKEAFAIHIVTSGELEFYNGLINEDYLLVCGSYSPLGPWAPLGIVDGDSDANDAWVVGFVHKILLQYINIIYVNTPLTWAGETFTLQALTVSYGGTTYESYNIEKNNQGDWYIGRSKAADIIVVWGYEQAVFGSNPSSEMWLKEYSIKAPWWWSPPIG